MIVVCVSSAATSCHDEKGSVQPRPFMSMSSKRNGYNVVIVQHILLWINTTTHTPSSVLLETGKPPATPARSWLMSGEGCVMREPTLQSARVQVSA